MRIGFSSQLFSVACIDWRQTNNENPLASRGSNAVKLAGLRIADPPIHENRARLLVTFESFHIGSRSPRFNSPISTIGSCANNSPNGPSSGSNAKETGFDDLTIRQRQIMNLVLSGKASKVIAFNLGISRRTVENHRAQIMKKTRSASIPALARSAFARQGCPLCFAVSADYPARLVSRVTDDTSEPAKISN